MWFWLQEPKCQTLPPPSFTGLSHSGVFWLLKLGEPQWTEPLLPASMGEPSPVSEQQSARSTCPQEGHGPPTRGYAWWKRVSCQRCSHSLSAPSRWGEKAPSSSSPSQPPWCWAGLAPPPPFCQAPLLDAGQGARTELIQYLMRDWLAQQENRLVHLKYCDFTSILCWFCLRILIS